MKKILNSVAIAGVVIMGLTFANPAKAQYQGIYGFGIELNAAGAGATNPGTSLYGLDNFGDNGGTDLLPTGSTATLRANSVWPDSSTGTNPTFSLGAVSSLTLNGGSLLTYSGGGGGYNSATLDYDLYDITTSTDITGVQSVGLPLNAANVTNGGNDRWSNESAGINLLTGLNTTDTYKITTFAFANNVGGGVDFYNNPNGGFQNYGATFTVAAATAPEPSTWAMLVGGLSLLAFIARRRMMQS